MNRRFPVLAFCCLVLLALATAPAMAGGPHTPALAQPTTKIINPDDPPLPPREPSGCALICDQQGGSPCDSCKQSFNTWTTCGQYWGHPANDLDGDGVVDTHDNCQCLANANQANCDGDAYGDACDLQDNSWKFISFANHSCFTDIDEHIYQKTIEFYYQNVYQSACTGQTCYKKYLDGSINCSLGSDPYTCCKNNWSWPPDCAGSVWDHDTCGLPRCTF